MIEHCDTVDADCDGDLDDVDRDGDGYLDAECGGEDCNDGLPFIYPRAPERCDGLDNNCDGSGDSCSQELPGALDFSEDLTDQWWLDDGWMIAGQQLRYSGLADDRYHYAVYSEAYFLAPYDITLDLSYDSGDQDDPVGVLIGEGYDVEDGVFVHVKQQQGRMVYNLGYRANGKVHSHTGHDEWPGLSDELGLPNSLRLVHDGRMIDFYINGDLVVSWLQPTYTQGALVLYTYDTTDGGGVDASFDNISVIAN